ncbi:MAG: hypothetical protein JWQ89_184 [Devosia sp.]|nr:hypothetical protein [Devosia sp.]
MIEQELGHFDVRAMTAYDWDRHNDYIRNMLFAACAASLSIVGAGAFFLSFWF